MYMKSSAVCTYMNAAACLFAFCAVLLALYAPWSPAPEILACFAPDYLAYVEVAPRSIDFGTVSIASTGTAAYVVGFSDDVPSGMYRDYEIYFEPSKSGACIEYDENTGNCITEEPYPSLCNALSTHPTGTTESYYANRARLHAENNPENAWQLFVHVPCLKSDTCRQGIPRELVGAELFCDVTVIPPIVVCENDSLNPTAPLAARRAYAQDDAARTIRVRAVFTDSSHDAVLLLPTEAPYNTTRGVVSSGPYPERGVADKDTFTFKVVYTNSENVGPEALAVRQRA